MVEIKTNMQLYVIFMCILSVGSAENLVELAQSLGANTLVKFIKEAGLSGVLATDGPFTWFGPTDAAFNKLPKDFLERLSNDKMLLAGILMYHVTKGTFYSSQFNNEQRLTSLLMVGGMLVDIRINSYNNRKLLTADGSPVVKSDQNATNGILHVVNRVLFPVPVRTIPDELVVQGRLNTFLYAAKKAKVTSLMGGGPFTMFAPTDDAFGKVPKDTLDKLLENMTALTDVLTYHMVKGIYWSASFRNGMELTTVEKQSITIDTGSDSVRVNTAKVIEPDLAATNGVIQVIDTVLLLQRLVAG